MESQDPRNPKLAIGRTMTETALRDDDDPWSGGSSDMTSAQDDHDAFDSGPSRVVHGSRSVEPPTAGDAQAFTGSSLVGDPQALRRQWESVQVGSSTTRAEPWRTPNAWFQWRSRNWWTISSSNAKRSRRPGRKPRTVP